jgi:hypothetical protein
MNMLTTFAPTSGAVKRASIVLSRLAGAQGYFPNPETSISLDPENTRMLCHTSWYGAVKGFDRTTSRHTKKSYASMT